MLDTHPELRDVLRLLARLVDDATMQRLNFEVDEQKRRPADVVREFRQGRQVLEMER